MSQPLTQLPAFRSIVIYFLTALGLLMTSLWLVDGSWFMASMVWAGVIGIALLPYPRVLAMVALATVAAPIFLLRHNLQISSIATAGLLLTMVLAYPRNRQVWSFNIVQFLALLYCANLLVIMFTRGFGLLVFGGEGAGAMTYVRMLLATALIFGVIWYPLRAEAWRWVILIMAIGSVLPVISDAAIAYGVALDIIPKLIANTGLRPGEAYLAGFIDTYFLRFVGAKETAIWFSVALIALAKPEKLFGLGFWRYLPILLIIATAATVSGFRIAILTIVGIFAVAAVVGGLVTLPRFIAISILGAVGLSGVYIFAGDLPLPVQRSFSFLPGIDISHIARDQAVESLEWRYEIWRAAVPEVRQYLLVGKGFTFSVAAFLYGQVSHYDWALLNSTYHSGPLSTLILTGLPGTILLISLQVALVVRHGRERRRAWVHPHLKNAHLAFYAYLLVEIGIFWIVYGDVASSVPLLLRQTAFLEGILATEHLARRANLSGNVPPPPLPAIGDREADAGTGLSARPAWSPS